MPLFGKLGVFIQRSFWSSANFVTCRHPVVYVLQQLLYGIDCKCFVGLFCRHCHQRRRSEESLGAGKYYYWTWLWNLLNWFYHYPSDPCQRGGKAQAESDHHNHYHYYSSSSSSTSHNSSPSSTSCLLALPAAHPDLPSGGRHPQGCEGN